MDSREPLNLGSGWRPPSAHVSAEELRQATEFFSRVTAIGSDGVPRSLAENEEKLRGVGRAFFTFLSVWGEIEHASPPAKYSSQVFNGYVMENERVEASLTLDSPIVLGIINAKLDAFTPGGRREIMQATLPALTSRLFGDNVPGAMTRAFDNRNNYNPALAPNDEEANAGFFRVIQGMSAFMLKYSKIHPSPDQRYMGGNYSTRS